MTGSLAGRTPLGACALAPLGARGARRRRIKQIELMHFQKEFPERLPKCLPVRVQLLRSSRHERHCFTKEGRHLIQQLAQEA